MSSAFLFVLVMKKSDFNGYRESDIKYCIGEYVRGERNKDIMKMALIDKCTYKEIADKYFLSETAVIKIVQMNGTMLLRKLI